MSERLDGFLGDVERLEETLVAEARRKEEAFCYKVHQEKVEFTEAARRGHRKFHRSFGRYLRDSRLMVVITSPIIWMCLIPMVLADVIGSFYQAVCFPIYGIPKVRRSDYLAFDRNRLGYLNWVEKLNCDYCAYVNGILAYFTEIAARTEQHWCPIKHVGCAKCAHSRYKKFTEFGDAKGYREHFEEIRRDYGDVRSHH
jgi:hypothetical protein